MKRNILIGILLVIALSSVACGNSVKQTESNEIENAIATWQEQYDLGIRYLEEGDYEQAIVAFTAAIEIDPKQAVVYVGRAQAYIESGETEENLSAALADYESALALDDMNPDIYLGMADAYIRQEDYEKAKEILIQALEKLGENGVISEKLNELENGNITDSNGKTRRRSGFDGSGNLLWYHDLIYDVDGKISKEIAYTADGSEIGEVDWLYDDKNEEPIQWSGETEDGSLEIYRAVYDADNVAQRDTYSLDGNLIGSYTYLYVDLGNEVEVRDRDGNISKYEYEDGNLTKSIQYYNDQLIGYNLFDYDSNGNLIGQRSYDAEDNSLGSVEYEREENNRVIKEYFYNADGNLEDVIEE